MAPSPNPTPHPLTGSGVYAIRPDGTGLRLVQPGVVTARLSPRGYEVASSEFCHAPSTLSIAELDQGAPTVIANFDGIVSDITWSPEGGRLLVGVVSTDHPSTPVVYLLDSHGGAPEKLFTGFPAWSPRGDRIAYVTNDNGATALYLFDLATHASKLVDSEFIIDAPIWSPDGNHLAYSSGTSTTVGDSHVVVVDSSGDTSRIVASNASLSSWMSDSSHLNIVLATGEQNEPVAIVLADGSSAPETIGAGTVVDVNSDGNLFAIYSHVRLQETQINMLNRATGSSVLISDGLTPTGDGSFFSPDGHEFGLTAEEYVYGSAGQLTGGSGPNSYVVDPDGTNLRKLADNAYFRGWSSDGRWIMLQANPATGCEQPFG